jgi:hypothetical protein
VVVELLDGPDQAHVPFLDQVQERHPAPDVLLRDRHHEPEVRLGELLLRDVVAGLDPLGEVDLVRRREQADPADLFQVHPHRVVEGDRVHHLDLHRHVLVGGVLVVEVPGVVGDLDPHVLEDGEDPEDLVRIVGVDVREAVEHVVWSEVALILPLDDQCLGLLDQKVLEPDLDLVLGFRHPCLHG